MISLLEFNLKCTGSPEDIFPPGTRFPLFPPLGVSMKTPACMSESCPHTNFKTNWTCIQLANMPVFSWSFFLLGCFSLPLCCYLLLGVQAGLLVMRAIYSIEKKWYFRFLCVSSIICSNLSTSRPWMRSWVWGTRHGGRPGGVYSSCCLPTRPRSETTSASGAGQPPALL